MFNIIKASKECYITESEDNITEFYYSKETGLLQEVKSAIHNIKYNFEKNTVKDSDVLKPEYSINN